MVADGLHRRCPSLHVVALLALRSHLSAMNVRVAIGALVSHVCEDRFCMALRTRNALMHAAKGEARAAVVEFGYVPDRLPSRKRMAILAGDTQRSMRTTCALGCTG